MLLSIITYNLSTINGDEGFPLIKLTIFKFRIRGEKVLTGYWFINPYQERKKLKVDATPYIQNQGLTIFIVIGLERRTPAVNMHCIISFQQYVQYVQTIAAYKVQ